MNRSLHVGGLAIALVGAAGYPLWAEALDQFAAIPTLVLMVLGLAMVWRSF